jgi:hypothetical protein
MIDYSKTWPKLIYLYGDMDVSYKNQTGRLAWFEHNLTDHAPIEYIRVDVAKAREEKLVDAAYLLGLNDKYPTSEEVYEAAEIEELK